MDIELLIYNNNFTIYIQVSIAIFTLNFNLKNKNRIIFSKNKRKKIVEYTKLSLVGIMLSIILRSN